MNRDRSQNRELLLKLMGERILFLDGATGTTIQDYNLEEEDFRGELLKDHPSPLKGNNEMLVLNRPDLTKEIHLRFLRAGADIVETNTFNGTTFSQAEYGTEHLVHDINLRAAQIAREACDEMEKETPDRPRFVAGCLGPTGKTLSLSPRVEEPGFRDISYDQLEQAYFDAAMSLIEGGADILIIETIFDTLNSKAAIMASRRAFRESGLELPIMISGTITDASGRTLSGQTAEAFLYSIEHADPISVGFNCALGATEMKAHVEVLSKYAGCGISTHPNAGLPDDMGNYLDTPEIMADILEEFAKEKLLNIVGGCCGTKPDHIAAITKRLSAYSPRVIPEKRHVSRYSGLEPLVITPDSLFINVGERNNVAGSRKFARLIREKQYEEALEIARVQVEDGANIVDVNLDDAMLESKEEMDHFLKLIASEPEISRVPLMIDSSKWEVLEAGLKCVQGKCIVNSISLKEGEEEFLEKASKIKEYGAAAVVMAFDEKGQADTKERKVEISRRSYKLLTEKVGFNPEDIIFDVNVFAVATGMEEHRNYGVDFIEAIREIKNELPYVRFSGGISNLSFSFRGNNVVREAMHTIFLYHAFQAGLDMGIVNAGQLGIYADIPEKLRNTAEDVILNRRPEAEEELLEMAQEFIGQGKKEEKTLEWRNEIPKERLIYGLMKGIHAFVDEDVQALLDEGLTPLSIIENTLMEGMNRIGDLFGAGKMFLPQVVKSARVMKKAVAILEPLMEEESGEATSNGTIIMATVKGDVHDIGKNIVSVVLQCNSFEVIDLGVMTPCEDIIAAAKEHNADIIGLSGLITPSLEEMSHVASVMEKEKFNIPLMIGGATTSSVHTAVKIAPEYESGCVVQVPDASRVPGILSDLLNKERREIFITNLKKEQQEIREKREKSRSELSLTPYRDALAEKPEFNWKSYKPCKPRDMGPHVFIDIPIDELLPLFEWPFYLLSCGMKGKYPDILTDEDKGVEAQKLIDDAHKYLKERGHHFSVRAMCAFYPAINRNDVLHYLDEDGNTLEEFPMVRQQNRHGKTKKFHSLADNVMPEESADGRTDYAGVFSATCMDSGTWDDPYDAMIMEALSYRLVEASAEWMENKVADDLWGYKAVGYEGIRPGPGYPACPDHTDKERIFRIMDVPGNIGTKMTDSYMMDPPASVCGYYFAHPNAQYFAVMGITRDQLEDYAAKKNQPAKEAARWLAVDIIDK